MTSGPAPVYSSDPIAPRPADPPAIVADATDLKVLRKAVEDASTVGVGLWVSYLFVLFYLLVAAGSVTHKDLFLETPVRLPFLGVDLPLKGFFVLGPLLFLIVHAYVLLHFAMLSGKVRAFDRELRDQINDRGVPNAQTVRADLRRQLPSNIFVQFLAGPPEIRNGVMGVLLWLIATVSLVIGPVCLLMFFELQFLPYHNEPITQWQRIAVVLDLILIWVFWRRIALRGGLDGEHSGSRARLMPWLQKALTLAILLALTVGSLAMMGVIATFPGEDLEKRYATLGDFPLRATLERWRVGLVAGEVQPASRSPESLWSNRLVLPGLDIVVHLKLDSEDKIKFLPATVSLRDRDLRDAVLIGAVLRKADFTGARMGGALLDRADLRDAKMECARWLDGATTPDGKPRAAICTDLRGASLDDALLQGASLKGALLEDARLGFAQLQGASLNDAQLQGALLGGAQLQGASLDAAQLQGAWLFAAQLQGASLHRAQLQGALLDGAELEYALLDGAQLQGASLDDARLQGASLNDAQLQGASLDFTRLQGASLDRAQLQGASLRSVFIWRANAVTAEATNAWIEPVRRYRSAPCDNRETSNICDWTKTNFDDLVAGIEQYIPEARARDAATRRLDLRLNPDTDKPPANEAVIQAWWKELNMPMSATADYEAERAKHWQAAGCSAAGAPHVVARMTQKLDPATSGFIRRVLGRPDPFSANSPEPAKLAAAFLSDACEGARGLSDADKAILLKLRGPVPAQPTVPSSPPRP